MREAHDSAARDLDGETALRATRGPMISGVITTRHVFRYAATIVREFGAAAYVRCCLVILRRQNTTFLDCVFARPKVA
jgi:hypothetical protein